MMHESDIEPRSGVPSHWRQVSFIAFDLGVMNVLAAIGVTFFHSVSLYHLGFRFSSFWLGIFFILAGLCSYKLRRLPIVVAISIIGIDTLNTILRLPRYEAAAAVVLVKISFLLPLVFTLIWMLRGRWKTATPEIINDPPRIGSGKAAAALLSSMFVSVGAGLTALLVFVKFALPPITESNNLLVNIFHDLFLAPVFLFLFPLGLAIGELAWMQASRLRRNELTLFIRYAKLFPLISRLAERMMRKDDSAITYQPASMNRGFWRRYVLVASVILLPIISCFILVVGLIVPKVLSEPAPEVAPAPSAAFVAPPDALVVSQKGDGQYRRIDDAVAAAPEGATIVVRPGVYHERIIIEKNITLVGDHKDRSGVTIKCYQGGCLSIIADKATIRNLTVVAKVGLLSMLLSRENPAAVIIVNNRSVMEEIDVTSNKGYGIIVSGSESAPEIRNVRAYDCKLNGILFTRQSQGVVENSEIYRNQWAGIRSEYGSKPLVRRSRLHSGKMDGILMDLQGSATLEECELFENEYSGVHVREGSSVSISRAKSFKNHRFGINIHDQSFAKVDACDVSANKYGGINVVDESDAQIFDTKVHHHPYAAIAVERDSTATIEGATIYENESGLRVENSSRPIVRRSVFRSHSYPAIEVGQASDPLIEQTQIYGGNSSGIYFYEGGKGRVNDCAVFGNRISNIVIRSGSNPQISNTRSSESGYAGVLVLEGAQGSITNCDITNNQLGIEIRSNGSLSVQGTKLTGNSQGAWKLEDGTRVVRQGNTE